MGIKRWGAVGGLLILAAVALPQGFVQVDLADPSQPGQFQVNNAALSTGTYQGNTTLEANMIAQWSGFGQRWQTPHDWSTYDAVALELVNRSGSTLKLGIRVEPTTNGSDMSLIEQSYLDLPPGYNKVVFDLKPALASSFGMRGLPPVYSTTHVRLYSTKTIQLGNIYGWWLYNRDTVPAQIAMISIRYIRRPASYPGVVDQYGQYASGDWPGKIYTSQTFAQQLQTENVDLNRYQGTAEYDGTRRIPPLAGTGRWRVNRNPSGKWYFVHPNGRLFWSFGLTTVQPPDGTVTTNRQSMFSSLPANSGSNAEFWSTDSNGNSTFSFGQKNLQTKFGSSWRPLWLLQTMKRVKSWGFNTLGPWSDSYLYQNAGLPYTINLNTNDFPTRLQTPFAYWNYLPDPFDTTFQSWATSKFIAGLSGHNGRTTFMGVYVDGEPSWGTMSSTAQRFQIAIAALNANYLQPAKQAFLQQLQDKYTFISSLNSAWGTNFASWVAMQQPNVFNQQSFTTSCQEDMRLFVISFADTYFAKVRSALSGAGCTALYLGCRDAWATPETTYAAMNHVDVYSVTLYKNPNDVNWTFPESTKPVIIAEFSYGAVDRGSFHPGPVGTNSQSERADLVRQYTNAAVRAQKVVGITWFQYYDQPITGRPMDGENYNVGLLSNTDTPYNEVIQQARNFGYVLYILRGR